MREVNFSIPNVNKASVHITTTLYDRRALDCTSTLPLINSLNHLAYLTTSSARIRDILTVDGGVERLVCILKEGRSKDEMHMWKWNLAFQCIVNIGVRGSENVRTRVVEADMVPVIATILHDYILVIEKEKEKAEAETARTSKHCSSSRHSKLSQDMLSDPPSRSSFLEHLNATAETRQPRRQAPPPSLNLGSTDATTVGASTGPSAFTSPPERTSFTRPGPPPHNRSFDGRPHSHRSVGLNALATAVPPTDNSEPFNIRPVREVHRLPSMIPALQSGIVSNPESPTTPLPPARALDHRRPRRPSIRHQTSTSADTEDTIMEDVETNTEVQNLGDIREPSAHSRNGSRDASPNGDNVDDEVETTLRLEIPAADEVDNVDIAQQTPTVANVLNAIGGPDQESNGTSPLPNAVANTASPAVPLAAYPNMFMHNATSRSGPIALMPRDEDVLMGLQLLAYISKYCYLRHYFQQTHLVPRLRIDREVERSYGSNESDSPISEPDEDDLEEYLQDDDYNIFPLVEKFTGSDNVQIINAASGRNILGSSPNVVGVGGPNIAARYLISLSSNIVN
ncbi:MYND-type zinc finger protein samB [Cyphellophora attinorum]|uniref:MYND-type zinc finger protein samB n=1 Tax=Cyphellophora attinorum TaxID=1664694 RepID=A0A0N1H2D8_9EURO|nr:MYND-type zinc finger protein samB [Phialophora attinorum]KPI38597.1 MYND-type zinc finger protein samB [Phialophora attinorum]